MYTKLLSLLALASVAHSHMHLFYPPTLKGDNNPHTQGSADPLLNYPYGCCGKEAPGPCKGHLDLLDTDEGKPVATWTAGEKANFTLSGAAITNTDAFNPVGGNHYGGSCQVGFSVDKGKTFKVATTWQGNCPLRHGGEDPSTQSFDFTVPADIPTGDVVFAWTWVNREKEFNMNCASVSIVGGNGETPAPPTTTTPAESPAPTETQYKSPNQPAQYTLEGCSCECPSEQWTSACSCQCESPSAKRHIIERKALALHRRNLQNAAKLNAPVRRTETVAFHSRPDMLLDIDFSTASCHSEGTDSELQFPNPGPEVVEGDGEYPLAEPSC